MGSLDLTGLGAAANAVTSIIDRFWPNKTEAEKAEMAAAMAIIQGQMDVNKVEAGSPSVFVSGWRPFIGWVCGAACAWNWIGLPVAKFAAVLLGHPLNFAPADLTEMLPLLMGMLGLGGLRSFEKVKGVAAK